MTKRQIVLLLISIVMNIYFWTAVYYALYNVPLWYYLTLLSPILFMQYYYMYMDRFNVRVLLATK